MTEQIKHKETCTKSGETYNEGYNTPEGCCEECDFEEWLPHIAPDMFWFDIQACGSYQGEVFGVAEYDKKIAIYGGYYGSCSGCGAWGEGGEPISQEEVLKSCILCNTADDAIEKINKLDAYSSPDKERMIKAVRQIQSFIGDKR